MALPALALGLGGLALGGASVYTTGVIKDLIAKKYQPVLTRRRGMAQSEQERALREIATEERLAGLGQVSPAMARMFELIMRARMSQGPMAEGGVPFQAPGPDYLGLAEEALAGEATGSFDLPEVGTAMAAALGTTKAEIRNKIRTAKPTMSARERILSAAPPPSAFGAAALAPMP